MKAPFPRVFLALATLITQVSLAAAQQGAIRNAFELWPDEQHSNSSFFGAREAAYVPGGLTDEQRFSDDSLRTASAKNGCPIDCPKDGYPSDSRGEADAGDDGASVGGCDQSGPCESCQGTICFCGDNLACAGCGGGYCGDCGSCSEGCCNCGGTDCCGCGDDDCCGDCINDGMGGGVYYAEMHNIFLRTHASSDVVGKLREKYEWSPRVVLGYESSNGIGSRVRWWSYSRTTSTLDDTNSLRFDLDVVDAEGTARFVSKRADLLLSGGFRWADFHVVENNESEVDAEMPGITFAADGRITICCLGRSQWSSVCGARWSILGGDWEGDNNSVIAPTFDDNVTAQEIYGGFECLCHQCSYDLYARIVFEVQNWHSDALGETSATDSISFVGPAVHAGVAF